MTRLQVQEQAGDSSGAPLDYEGRIGLDPILLDVERLVAALETGVFELSNTRVHQNLLLHHISRSMAQSAVLLRELCNMAGRAYRPADLLEISWRDLQWVELQRRASLSQREELPVVMYMVIFRTIFFELLVFFTFTLLIIYFAY